MIRHLLLSSLCLMILPAAPGAATAADGQALGPNLVYQRVHALPDDLPASASGTLILDLRFVPADPGAAAGFARWLKSRARPRDPVIVLINGETSPALFPLLSLPAVPPGVVTIGPETGGAVPAITLPLDAAADRAAYEALEHGMTIEDLVNPKVEKVRHDEAAMARGRAPGSAAAEDGDLTPTAEDNAKATPSPVPAPLVDRVLQRAVQLDHALHALGKL